MRHDPYANFRPRGRLDRVVRVIVLASVAALGGVIAGGVSVFAVVNVLTPAAPHPVHDTTAPATALVTATPQTVAPAPARDVAAVVSQGAMLRPPSTAQTAPPPNAVVTAQPAPPAVTKEQNRSERANQSENRAADAAADAKSVKAMAARAATATRPARPLYGYAPQPSEDPAQRQNETARNTPPSPRERADTRDGDDTYVRQDFFGRDEPAGRDWSSNDSSNDMSSNDLGRGFANDADEAPRGVGQSPRNVDQRRLSGRDRDQVNARSARRRPRYDQRGDDQFDNLIGNDEWVGDWHH